MLSVSFEGNNASSEDESEVCDNQFVRVESLRGGGVLHSMEWNSYVACRTGDSGKSDVS